MTIDIRFNLDIDDATLHALVSQHRFGRYCEDTSLPLDASRRLVGERTRLSLAALDAVCIEAVDTSGRTLGILPFKVSQWDTDHFGYPCVVVDSVLIGAQEYHDRREVADTMLAALDTWLESRGIRFTSVRVSTLDLAVIHAIQHHGFDFIEAWAFNHRRTKTPSYIEFPPYPLRPAQAADERIMLDFSHGAFDTQRFHADPRIDRRQADTVYESWITSSFRDPQMRTLVYEHDGSPVAYMTYYRSDLTAYFGLKVAMWKMALLDPKMRGRGIGTHFFRSLIHYHGLEGLDVVDSGLSLRNGVSLNLHNKCDFKITSTVLTFHRWPRAREHDDRMLTSLDSCS